MSSFAALMALSATQTRESEAAVQSALVERQKKEAEKRKLQEEKDKKDRELEAKLRLKRFEEEKNQRERERKLEEARLAKEREKERREEEQRNSLRYGQKRSGGGSGGKADYPSKPGRRYDSDDESGGALTREEKRKRRLESELRYGMGSYRKGIQAWGHKKSSNRLPGGVIDVTNDGGGSGNNSSSSSRNFGSIKARITSEPNMLIRLNTKKRDTRTIDEITRDIAKSKGREGKVTLEGDQAKVFSDWFGSSGSKGELSQTTTQSQPVSAGEESIFGSPASSPEPELGPSSYSPKKQLASTGYNTSASKSATPPVQPKASTSAAAASKAASSNQPRPTPTRGSSLSVKAIGKPTPPGFIPKASSSSSRPQPKPLPAFNKKSATNNTASSSAKSPAASSAARKRPRSPSYSISPSPSPPPSKRRSVAGGSSSAPKNDISAAIWQMFGKDRNKYMSREVYSDDEDMEADASALEREEMISSRIARKEEEIALEAERLHNEEKKRKRKDRGGRL